MRKSIFTIAILALSFVNVNATEVTTTSNNTEISTLTKNDLTVVYDWSVKTTQGEYSGTSSSLQDAEKMIRLVAVGEVILDKKIESFYQVIAEKNDKTLRLYFWEVESATGKAKGFSSSEKQAQRMIQLVSSGDVVSSKIIIAADYK
jgi:hypothetical protein